MWGFKTLRWNRIFRADGRSLVFAMDHAAIFGVMEGLERPGEVIAQVRAGGADAILTSYGVCTRFGGEIGGMGVILRADGGTSALSRERHPLHLVYDARDALRIGADAVGVMGMPGSQFEHETLPYLSEIVGQCVEWGIPVMAEMLPGGFENPDEMWTAQNIAHACRIGAELGVDFIKTTYSGDVESFRQVVRQTYVPLIVLGGKSKDPRELLTMVYEAMQAGASGVAVGRSIYCYAEPVRITAAVAAVIHENATVDVAMGYL